MLWIGLSNINTSSNKWSWSDNTPLIYSNWKEGQPSDGNYHCGLVSKKLYFSIILLTLSLVIDLDVKMYLAKS